LIRSLISFFGGLMKKSFFYAAPAALILALLFTGCPQDSDDDDGGGSSWNGESYQKDVEGIAVAFADGAPVVYLKDNLHLDNEEVVIPAGKTLDLSQDVTIDQIGPYGKIVVVGDIKFNTGEYKSNYDIILHKSPTAKIIAMKTFIDAHVEGDYVQNLDGSISRPRNDDGITIPADPNKQIKALPDQVIEIDNFDITTESGWVNYLTNNPNADYIPVLLNTGTINRDVAEVISKYGAGRKLYLIGDVKITGDINLLGDRWIPPNENSNGQQYNVYGEDKDGSLLIGGAVVFEDKYGQVSTKGGFTVLGTLTTTGDRGTAKVNAAGPLVTYLVRLGSGGVFSGPVKLIGTLPSKLAAQAVFEEILEANGTVIIDRVTFKKTAIFNGPVEFIGPEGSVEGDTLVVLKNSVIATASENPIDISKFDLSQAIDATYNVEYGTKGTVVFMAPITFDAKATFGGSATFAKGVRFNSDVVLNQNTTYLFGSVGLLTGEEETYFTKDIELKKTQLQGGSFNTAVIFNSNVTFAGEDVLFTKNATFNGNLTLGASGTFAGNAEFKGDVTLEKGKVLKIANGKELVHTGGLILSGLDTDGIISADAGYPLKLTNGNLVVEGTVSLNKAGIDISKGGEIHIDAIGPNSGIVFGSGAVHTDATAKGYIVSEAYDVLAGTTQGGTLVGLFGTRTAANTVKYVSLTNAGFSGDGSGSQATLRVAGSNAVRATNISVKKDIAIDGVTIDLVDAVDNKSAGSISVTNGFMITLKGGNGTVTDGKVSAGAAGGIRTAGTVGVYGGNAISSGGLGAGAIVPGYLVSLNGNLVAGTSSGTIVADVGTKGKLDTAPTVGFITNDTGFAVYYEKSLTDTGAITIVNSKGETQRFDEVTHTETGGSVAVFAGTLAQ
jgi:hypothetical protein